jgi:hypothetical protein
MEITRNIEGDGEEFWRVGTRARTKVEGWPEWKRKLRVTKYYANSNRSESRPDASAGEPDKEQ